jgi:hypothetical protein
MYSKLLIIIFLTAILIERPLKEKKKKFNIVRAAKLIYYLLITNDSHGSQKNMIEVYLNPHDKDKQKIIIRWIRIMFESADEEKKINKSDKHNILCNICEVWCLTTHMELPYFEKIANVLHLYNKKLYKEFNITVNNDIPIEERPISRLYKYYVKCYIVDIKYITTISVFLAYIPKHTYLQLEISDNKIKQSCKKLSSSYYLLCIIIIFGCLIVNLATDNLLDIKYGMNSIATAQFGLLMSVALLQLYKTLSNKPLTYDGLLKGVYYTTLLTELNEELQKRIDQITLHMLIYTNTYDYTISEIGLGPLYNKLKGLINLQKKFEVQDWEKNMAKVYLNNNDNQIIMSMPTYSHLFRSLTTRFQIVCGSKVDNVYKVDVDNKINKKLQKINNLFLDKANEHDYIS